MKNRKTTKYALVTSIVSIFLCAVMLMGTTFAWFTDEASTAVNTIQSGILDVALVDDAGEDLEGSTLGWIKADGSQEVLWEPGCTYTLETANIVNNGNLALKYKVAISGIDGDAKLLEAIEFTTYVNGEIVDLAEFEGALLPGEDAEPAALVIEGHMKEEAGNEYQNLSIDGIAITVKAAQLPHEFDSYDNQYDANAEYGDEADVEEPTEPEIFVPETFFGKLTDAHNLVPSHTVATNTYDGKDAVLVTEKVGTTVITVKNIQAYDVKTVIYLAEGSTTEEIVFDGGHFSLDEGDEMLVMNYSGSDVKVTIKGTVTLKGGVKVTSAAQLAPYLVNVSNIAFA